jgi:hypothetical protein
VGVAKVQAWGLLVLACLTAVGSIWWGVFDAAARPFTTPLSLTGVFGMLTASVLLHILARLEQTEPRPAEPERNTEARGAGGTA